MMTLKDRLLQLDLVIDNEYLDKYIDLISKNSSTKREKFKTQRHHIVPISYFKIKHVLSDSSDENLVNLIYSEHILAHYYLYRCSKEWFKYHSLRALTYLINRVNYNVFENDIILLQTISNLSELKYIDNLNEHYKNKNGKWMNNKECQQYVRPDRINEFISLGYTVGKLPLTDETKRKIGNSRLGKKRGPHTAETKRKISIAHTGKKLSNETKEKIRQINLGKTAPNKGIPCSDEQKRKISETLKGNVPWNTGKHFSEESKKKMSESRKRYFERIKND